MSDEMTEAAEPRTYSSDDLEREYLLGHADALRAVDVALAKLEWQVREGQPRELRLGDIQELRKQIAALAE